MEQFEKVRNELEEMRNFADTDVHPAVSPDNWDVYSDLCDLIDKLTSDALALIRQQQERIAELEAELGQRDYNAAVEMQQYCKRYEPTYNPEDGSM